MAQDSFIEALLPAGFGRNERLERIAGLIDWDRLAVLIRKVPGETGRPPYEPVSMFKALLLQQWYGLSDPGLEEALLDRVSFRRFCGFALDAQTPDETTLCRFRNALQQAGLGEVLFQEVLRQLEAAGYVLKTGTLIDATLVQSSGRKPKSGSTPHTIESRSSHDPDANWTRQGPKRRLFFGYKAHLALDQGSGLIRARRLTKTLFRSRKSRAAPVTAENWSARWSAAKGRMSSGSGRVPLMCICPSSTKCGTRVAAMVLSSGGA